MKRAFAMVLAVTLFFSFAVVGYAEEQVNDPLSGELLSGSVSFMDTLTVQADLGSSYPMIGNASSFTAPVGARNRFAVYPAGTASGSDLLLAPIYQYRLTFDIQVPFAPTRLLIQYYGSDGSTILGDWYELTSDNYSYVDGRFVFDSLVSVSQVCRLRNVTVWFDDQTLTESFTGSVGDFTFANVGLANTGGVSVSSTQFRGVYYTGNSATATTGVFDNGQGVSVDSSFLPSGSFTPIVTLKPNIDYYFSFTGRYSDVPIYNFYVYSSSGVVPVSTVVNEGYFRVTGVIESGSFSLSSPLTLYISSDNGYVFHFRFDSAEFIPVGSVSGAVGEVSGDVGLASFIGSFFSDLYDSFTGFLISREDADESTYEEANNDELPGKIEEAYTASEQVDSFEQQMWTDLDTYSSDINPDSFSFGPEFISSMGWIAATWTDCFNGLGSWQSIITFPMFLGLAMLIIGRGSQAIDRGVAKHERAQRREAQSRAAYKRHEELMDKLG